MPAADLVRFVQSLSAASSLRQLERSFLAGFGRLMDVEIWGYNLYEPLSGNMRWFAATNVSDTFLARYGLAQEADPILARALRTGRTTYNRAIMSAQEWEQSIVYRNAYRLHGIQHVVEVPLTIGDRISGNLHFGAGERDFGADDIRLADAVGSVIASAVERIDERTRTERERDQALTALDLTGTALVISDPRAVDPRLNDAARRLLAGVVDGEDRLYQLLARPATDGAFSRRLDVRLAGGERATLHGHASPMPAEDGGVVAVLELEAERTRVSPSAFASLTPRERDVAVLVVEGLADREIAARLSLSHHTVSQHVKRIYRKLGVDSRVALTRAALRHH